MHHVHGGDMATEPLGSSATSHFLEVVNYPTWVLGNELEQHVPLTV